MQSEVRPWGFYGHRLINKMAVFTLPQDVLGFYKKHIHYITEHAVDPDKRRYALKNEAYRHYVDLDHWDAYPFVNVSRDLETAILAEGVLWGISIEGDTVMITEKIQDPSSFYEDYIYLDRYSPTLTIEDASTLAVKMDRYSEVFFENKFVNYGVLPYFLEDFYLRLVYAMSDGNVEKILKVSADMGHYIGDAHVPLHTTENYNGQLTDQIGIHAFWESRLPELFAEEQFDMVVGKAQYIDNKKEYFWGIILESHSLLAEVLDDEWNLKQTFPEDRQFCFDKRGETTVRTQCPEYAEAYHEALDGMVEKRMQDAILSIGSVWYSAWIDAGQPILIDYESNLDEDKLDKETKELDSARGANGIYGRNHGR